MRKNLIRFLAGLVVSAFAGEAVAQYESELATVAALGDLTNAPALYANDVNSTPISVAPGERKAVFYDALDYQGSPTRVYAYLGIPAGASAGSPVPGIILVHGGGGTAYHEWVDLWTSRGYAAISIAVEGQTDGTQQPTTGDGWHQHNMAGPARVGIYGDSSVDPITDQWMYHAVADTILANSLLRSLPEVAAADVGVMGISWGGVITSTAIGIDDRFRFAIPTYGCGNKDIAENIYGDSLGSDELYKNVWDPMVRIANATMPVLWYSWPEEWHFPLYCQRDTYMAAPGERMVSLVPGMQHGHSPAWNRPESYDYADSIINTGTGWCVQQSVSLNGNTAEAVFTSSKVLTSATIISTVDGGLTGDRFWSENPAVVVDNGGGSYTVTATLPDYSTAWFINVTDGTSISTSDYQETGVTPPVSVVYSSTANWSSQTVKGNDAVTIKPGVTVTVDQQAAAGSITVNDGPGQASTLQLDQNMDLAVSGGGGLLLGAGNGAGIVNHVNGAVTTTALTLSSSGSQYNFSSGTVQLTDLTIGGGGTVDINGGTMTKLGLSAIEGDGLLKLQSGAFYGGTGTSDAGYLNANVEVSGGTFELLNQLHMGAFGAGPCEFKVVGDAATITMKHLQFSSYTASQGTLKWVLNATGVSTINMTEWMFLDDAIIVVDGSAYAGGSQTIDLINGVSINGLADPGNITVTGFGAGYTAQVVQNQGAGDLELVITQSGGSNQPPAFNTDPVVEANATEGAAYSSTLADDAVDPEADPMAFSKVSGPAWLSVASDGSLSGTPATSDVGLNSFSVQVSANGGNDTAVLEITVDAAGPVTAATFAPWNDGNWSTSGTSGTWGSNESGSWAWATRVPGIDAADYVVINELKTVSLDVNATVATLQVQNTANAATLNLNTASRTLTVNNGTTVGMASGGAATVNIAAGTLDSKTAVTVNTTGLIDINGGTLSCVSNVAFTGGGQILLRSGALSALGGGGAGAISIDGVNVEVSNGALTLENEVALGQTAATELKIVGNNATVTMTALNQQTNAPNGTFNFTLDESGVSPVTITSSMELSSAIVIVDGSAYNTGFGTDILLFDAPALGSLLNSANLTVIGLGAEGVDWSLYQNVGSGNVGLTLSTTSSNHPPAFSSDPIVKANATENTAYSSSIGSDASDPESDSMTFSKVSGPAWLNVATDGTLSGTPVAGDIELNSFTVQVVAQGGNDTATLQITVDALQAAVADQDLNYTYMYFENGYPTPVNHRRPAGDANLAARANPDLVFQTGYYSLMLDCDDMQLKGYDTLVGTDYRSALTTDVTVFNPATNFLLRVYQGGVAYDCTNAVIQATGIDNVRVIESGQYVQRIDHLGLVFKDSGGNTLNVSEEARLEVTAWPDRVTLMLDFSAETSNPISRTVIQVQGHETDVTGNQARLTVKPQVNQKLSALNVGSYITEATRVQNSAALTTSFDEDEYAFHIEVPADSVSYPAAINRVDEYVIEVTNPLGVTENIPLVFEQPFVRAITGTIMLLCDETDGRPLGIPVQLSKNWHKDAQNPTMHEGDWMRGSTMLTMAPGETRRMKLRVVYGYWGAAGAVSHSQLSLIGYGGGNWLWEESALGSWGESFCYDPEQALGGAFLTDVRPSFTDSMTSGGSYDWTENIGGGDFLIYRDSSDKYRWGTKQKTCYNWIGPNLTEILYTGVSDDDKIRFTYTSRAGSTLDYHRRFHNYKYEFLQNVSSPQRLVFYQMVADHYNYADFNSYYIGDETGLLTSGTADPGGNVYKGSPVAIDGKWLSIDDTDGLGGTAKALRGMIPLSSTLNGSAMPLYLHTYGTDYANDMCFDFSSSSVNTSYSAGDVVEGEIEFVLPPKHVNNYWGSDSELVNRLTGYGTATWEPVRDEFVHNVQLDATVNVGTELNNYPLEIQVGTNANTLVDVTINSGGIGHVPLVVKGAASGLELKAQRYISGAWTDLENVDLANNSYYQAVKNADGTADYTFTIARPSTNLAEAWRIRIVDVNASTPNQPPAFTSDPIVEVNATESAAYAGTIADDASDPESDTMTFSKVSGPAWLSVASNGSLSGTPSAGDIGLNSFTVQVDATGGSDTATLEITVNSAPANQPPVFTSDPIVEVNATEDAAYSSSIADNANDPESDPMTFSKVSGPAWLSVAANGALSGTPAAGDVGLNSFTVQVDATGGSDTATLEVAVDAASGMVDDYAQSETTTLGSVASGSISDTLSNDDVYQVLREAQSGGNPNNRRSQLEHRWTFNVTGGELVTFYVEAHHTVNSEGDDFIFAYSDDGVNYTDMLTVTKTVDNNTAQFYVLPGGISGTVYIRVVDTDRTPGNRSLDDLSVDALFIVSEAASAPPTAASNPDPADGATGVSVNPTLSWTAGMLAASHDVYFGTSPSPAFQGNQSGASFSPGTLSTSTTYYWAVDEVNSAGSTSGPVWSFTTGTGTPQMYVASIVLSTQKSGRDYRGRATVNIVESGTGNPVQGATVTGDFTGVFAESGSAVTDAAGNAVITTAARERLPYTFTFTVTDVTEAGHVYNPSSNVETSETGSF